MPRLPRRPRRHPRRHPRRRSSALALVAALTLVAAGCTGGDEPDAEGPTASPSAQRPLAAYDATGLALTRTSPCPDLPEEAVTAALGGEVTGGTAYANGEKAPLAPGVREVAQESGCVFRGEDGTTARAWVFAPPLTADRARSVARALRRQQGCQALEDAPAFGKPGVGRTCERGQRVVASYGGLFGDAWVGCSLAVPRAATSGEQGTRALVPRTGAWCVAVLEAARQASG